MTDNHAYNRPAENSTDWHIPLNQNFNDLDTDVEVRDLDANLSNYTPHTGAKFLGTDSLDVYTGDGTAWTRIGSISDDAQTLDGYDSGAFAVRAENETVTGAWTFQGPDDAGQTISILPGADTTATGTPSITLDLQGDLTDGATLVWDSSVGAVPQAQLGGPASSLSAYPLSVGTDTDGDLAGTNLVDGATTIWDATNAYVPSAQVQGLDGHTSSTANPHSVTANQVGVVADSATASGDGTVVTFTLSHSLGTTPASADVTPTSADAAGDFYVSAKTSTGVDVTYLTAPASGTSNLSWDLITR